MTFLSPRGQAALRYLRGADPFYRWRVSRARCPACGGGIFLSLRSDAFMTRCLTCRANGTNLALIPVVEQHRTQNPVQVAWEMSTYGSVLQYLKASVPKVIESEFFPGQASGAVVGGVLNQDVQNLSFGDASLDLITSNQVFEHVPDDLAGYAECYRVLRHRGALVFTVPLYGMPSTVCMAELADGAVLHHHPPEYHDSRTAGLNSALVFWHHSVHDILQRVASAGFRAELVEVRVTPAQQTPERVIYAVKA